MIRAVIRVSLAAALIALTIGFVVYLSRCDVRGSWARAGGSVDLSRKVHMAFDEDGCACFARTDNLEPIWSVWVGDGCISRVHRISGSLVVGLSQSRSSSLSAFVLIDLDTGTLREARGACRGKRSRGFSAA
jgi:hypothetical protein